MDLKRAARDMSYPGIRWRAGKTIEFMCENYEYFSEPYLDIGEENAFANHIYEFFENSKVNTVGDFNLDNWKPIVSNDFYRTVTCFEVIEHLKNPDLFLRKLTDFISPTCKIFISFPEHILGSRFWSSTHFNEYSEELAEELFSGAGYEILKHKKYIIPPHINGIRPILRLPRQLLYLSWQHFYILGVV